MVKKSATGAPDDLCLEDKIALWKWVSESSRNGLLPPWYKDKAKVRSTVTKCLLHHSAKGNTFVNWLSATKNWFLKQAEFDGWKEKHIQKKKPTQNKRLREEQTDFGNNLKGIESILRDMNLEDK